MTSDPAERLGVIGVVDAVTRRLRDRILAGEVDADTALTEAKVSAAFGVARPSAKAAIEQLVASGLLMRTAHRSARVVAIDAAMVRDVYRTRMRLESSALRELARARAVPDDARSANAELLAMPAAADTATVDPDLRFHTALIDAVGSIRTSRMYRSVLDEVRLCMAQVQGRRLLKAAAIAQQHAGILDAIGAGDADRAATLLAEHLTAAEDRLVVALAGSDAARHS
ncbi:GntR family transcriptional regulator [Microbacterium sp. 1.5R]|uniref:GntR family transcriptional regulator n=1 Tax=Microbacterium sp. 1.5R TaxID=1916917 RepID=UPI00119CCD97|nr:GntR family transcriptional regulator [Microbacterium sp. 1.5R]